jgi:hypothetical protein
MSDFVGQAVGERISGGRPSWPRALGAAVVIGAGAAFLAYRLLRSGSGDNAVSDAAD